jgi:hypothetical protein
MEGNALFITHVNSDSDARGNLMKSWDGGGMGEQMYLERFGWFDAEARHGHSPNAFKLAAQFEVSTKTAQRSIDYFRDSLQALLKYVLSRKGYHYTDSSYQLPATHISESELLILLISHKLIVESSVGSLSDELDSVSRRLGSLLAKKWYDINHETE